MPTMNYTKNMLTVRIDHRMGAHAVVGWLLHEHLTNALWRSEEGTEKDLMRSLQSEVRRNGTPDYADTLEDNDWPTELWQEAVRNAWDCAIKLGFDAHSVVRALALYSNVDEYDLRI